MTERRMTERRTYQQMRAQMRTETPAPQAPDDPTRTREAIGRRITALLTHDYHGDTETQALCREAAKMARCYFYGDYHADLWLRLAERAAAQSDRLEELGEEIREA